MADSKLSALTPRTAPALTDLLYLTDSGGTTDYKAALADLLGAEFTAKGSLIVASAADTAAELLAGSDFQFLRARAGATNGAEWATLASAATVTTAETTTSATYADLATVGPAVTITTGTSVLLAVSGSIYNGTVGDGGVFSVAVSGATTRAAADDHLSATVISSVGGTTEYRVGVVALLSGLTAGSNTFTMKYRIRVGGTAGFLQRHLIVIPI